MDQATGAAPACGKKALDTWGAADEDEDDMTPFLHVVRSGTATMMTRLVETVGDGILGECTSSGMSCLHIAAERRDGLAAGVIRYLLDTFKGRPELPHVDARDAQSFTPLHLACMHGDVEAAKELLRRGAAVGAKNDRGSAPLHWAASRGHTQIVKLLVGVYGADCAMPAGNGSTPLHWAASKGRRGVIKILLGIFCAQVDVKDDKGCTPCFMAALNGHLKVVELLIDRFESQTTVCDRKRASLLHAACEMGHGELASVLIERYNISVESQDRKGLTPLARAAQRNQVEVFRLLVHKHGAQLGALTANQSGLLHVACEAGALDVAKILLEQHGFEVDARNASGDTPALLAAARGNADVLALLVDEHGASLDAADDNGVGALHAACERRQSGVASVLLESYGLPADKTDPSGATALHVAARGGDTELVELLTGPRGRADIGLRDGEGNQALHIAAACGHLGVVKVLVEKAGADLGARDRSDRSALDVAVGKVKTEIADYLRDALPDKHREYHRCKKRGGFERAGRWMRVNRAKGFLPGVALESVFLLPVPLLLESARFPSHYDASRRKQLVTASDISPQAQVLLVSHPWESPGNPDPSGTQFLALRRFLEEAGDKGAAGAEGGKGGGGFAYVWLAFSCTSSNRMKPAFQTHLDNLLTAWCFCDHALVIPETVNRATEGFTYTDVEGFVERGWCCVQLLCALHLGVPTTLYVALKEALSDSTNKRRLSPSGQGGDVGGGESAEQERALELESVAPSSVFELLPAPDAAAAAAALPLSEERVGLLDERSQRSCRPSRTLRSGDGRTGLSAGKCVTWAVLSASRRLSSRVADAAAGTDAAAVPPMPARLASTADAGTAAVVGGSCLPNSNDADGDDLGSCSMEEAGLRQEATEESSHILNLVWSSGAEAHLDSVAQLVADILTSLDDEVSSDIKAKEMAAGGDLARETLLSGGGVPEDSKAGLLLARVLSLSLDKSDVGEDGGGGGGKEAMACPLVRELHEKVGNFSSAHERLDAVKTLLLAGCYLEAVRASSGLGSRGLSPELSGLVGGGAAASPPALASLAARECGRLSGGGQKGKDRGGRGRASGEEEWQNGRGRPSSGGGGKTISVDGTPRSSSSSGGGKAKAAGTSAPLVAGSVPSCHVS